MTEFKLSHCDSQQHLYFICLELPTELKALHSSQHVYILLASSYPQRRSYR